MASAIMTNYLAKEVIDTKDALIEEQEEALRIKDEELEEKEDKIDQLMKELREMREESNKESKKLSSEINEVKEDNKKILKTVKTIAKRQVLPTSNPNDDNILVIIQNYPYADHTEDRDDFWHFHALRVMKGNEKTRLNKHTQDYPDMKVIRRIKCEPNAVILWKRIKERLSKCNDPVLCINGCKFNVIDDEWSVKDVVNELVSISNEKLNVVAP